MRSYAGVWEREENFTLICSNLKSEKLIPNQGIGNESMKVCDYKSITQSKVCGYKNITQSKVPINRNLRPAATRA